MRSLPRPRSPAARHSARSPRHELSRSIRLLIAVALKVPTDGLLLLGVTASRAGPASLLARAFAFLVGLPLPLWPSASRMPEGSRGLPAQAVGSATGALVGWLYFTASSVGQAVVTLTGAYSSRTWCDVARRRCTAASRRSWVLFAVVAYAIGLRVSG